MRQITVDLPTKSYVDHFIKMNFGVPADFAKEPQLNEEFRRCLIKPNNRYGTRYSMAKFAWHKSITQIKISEDDFYRYGWEITKNDIISFNKTIEHQCKQFAHTMITAYSILMPKNKAILKFQENFGFTEDIWSFESIKKDYYRNCKENKVDFATELIKEIEKYFMVNLSKIGTISHTLILSHGNNK